MSEWQPIETAPKDGRFLAWRPRVKGPCVVEMSDDGAPGMVVDVESSKCWITEWWMPLPAPPLPSRKQMVLAAGMRGKNQMVDEQQMRKIGVMHGMIHALAKLKIEIGRATYSVIPTHHTKQLREREARIAPLRAFYESLETDLRELRAHLNEQPKPEAAVPSRKGD